MSSKIKLKICKKGGKKPFFKLTMIIDQQSFDFDYRGSRREVQWYKNQVNIAFKRVFDL